MEDIIRTFNRIGDYSVFGIKDKFKIVDFSKNSIHQLVGIDKNKPIIKATFYCNNEIERILSPILEKYSIANDYKKITNKEDSILHFSGLYQRLYKYPTVYLDSSTLNTGAGDGIVANNATGQTWANYRADTNADKADYTSATASDKIGVELFGGQYYGGRLFLPINTSSLPDNATITAAVLSIWTNQVSQQPTAVAIQTSQASTSSLATTDFDNLTLGTAGSAQTNISNNDTETQFTLNATGLGWISLTGFSMLGVVAYEDSVNSAPASNMTWSARMSEYSATDPNKIPKIVITYTVPSTGLNIYWKSLLGVGI